jgi:hypothetical protein
MLVPGGTPPWGGGRRRSAGPAMSNDSALRQCTHSASEAGECKQVPTARHSEASTTKQRQLSTHRHTARANLCVECLLLTGTYDWSKPKLMFESSGSQTTLGKETMTDMRSRSGILVGVAAAVGAFGAAAMMSAATAPIARADDFTDVFNVVDSDFTAGQADFSSAFTDFGSSDVNDGLAALFSGVDADFVIAPDNLYIGTLDLVANQSVTGVSAEFVPPESSFASGLGEAEFIFSDGESFFTQGATALSSGDYAGAAFADGFGSFYDAVALQVLLEGVVASF